MKKTALILCLLLIISITGCTEGDILPSVHDTGTVNMPIASTPPISIENDIPIETPVFPESFTFLDEEFNLNQANDVMLDENNNPLLAIFENIAFIKFMNEDSIIYKKVVLEQEINGLKVEDASICFELFNGEWLLSENTIGFSGTIKFIGNIHKTPKGEFEILSPGTLTFHVIKSENDFIPLAFNDSELGFILSGYNPEDDNSKYFYESNTIYTRVILDGLRLRYTNRATGGNYAQLVSVSNVEY